MNKVKASSGFAIRMLGIGFLTAVLAGAGVALIGLLLRWQTAVQFSNGLFVAGAAVIIFGALAVVGGFTSRGSFALSYSQSVSAASGPERTKQMIVEILRGYNALTFCVITGVILIGLSILIYTVFG